MHRSIRTWVVAAATLGLLVAGAGTARAQQVVVTEPAAGYLDFGPVNLGATSPSKRITLTNIGTADPLGIELYIDNPDFGIMGTGGDLAPGHSAYWDVAVSPTHLPCVGNFSYRYRSAQGDDFAVNVHLECTARRVPLDAPSEVSFEEVGPGTITRRLVHVTNTGAVPQTINALTSTSPVFTARLRSGMLPITVAPEATVDLEVRFAPTAALQFFEGDLAATFAGGGTVPITTVHGRTSDVVKLLVPTEFYPISLGQTRRIPAQFENYTATPVTLTSISISNPAFALQGIAAGDVLPPFSTVPLYVAITPIADGPLSASYTLTFDTAPTIAGGWQAGAQSPRLRVTTNDGSANDGLLDFGELTATSPPATRTVTIDNPGTAAIYVECRMFGTTGDGFTSISTCPNLLMPGDSVEVAITFTPTPSEPGTRPDRRFSAWRYTELGTMHVVVELTAVVPTYHFTLSAYDVALPDAPPLPSAPTVSDVSITNTSLTPIPIPTATITGDGFSLVSAPPPGTLGPFATVTYRAGFAPPATGTYEGTLQLGSLAEVPLRGAGVVRAIGVDPAALDFGDVPVQSTVSRTITIHNAGTTSVSVTSLVIDDSRFRAIAPADATIPAGGDLELAVEFMPSVAGSLAGRLDIGFDADPSARLTVALSGVGVAAGGDDGDGGCCSTNGGPTSILLGVVVIGLLARRRARAPV